MYLTPSSAIDETTVYMTKKNLECTENVSFPNRLVYFPIQDFRRGIAYS